MSKIISIIAAVLIILVFSFIYIKLYPNIKINWEINKLFEEQKKAESGNIEEDENFNVKPIPEEQIPIVEIVNQTFSQTNIKIKKMWRIKFVNKDNKTYTLLIPDIGIEEELVPEASTEPTFYKNGSIIFWIKELGINATNGTVYVE